MKTNNSRRKRNPNGGNRRKGLATPIVPSPAYPGDVRVKMRLGIGYNVNLTVSPLVTVLNDVTTSVVNWSVRAADFLEYRVIGGVFHLQPRTTATGTPSATDTKTWLSAIFESVGLVPAVSLPDQILELPNCDVRPMNTANPRSGKRYNWRVKDLNALIFGPTSQAPVAQSLNLVTAQNNGAAITGWQLQVNGYVDVEFKGLATV